MRKLSLPATWRRWLILTVTASSCLGISSCPVNNPNPNAPGLKFRGKLYVTDAASQTISRKDKAAPGGIDTIKCEDPRFNNRVCVTVDEYKRHIQELNDLSYQCLEWRE